MAASDPLIGQLVEGRWRILDRLGAGGMGVVYRAERLKIFKLVAIKFLDERCAKSPESVARFEREARAISRLHHRHVVSILDFGVHERRPYIVMEYLAGLPLNKEVGRPTMTPARGVAIVCQILEALRHAHKAGVIHRDLKPENVMLAESTGTEDYAKILDFGLARIISLDEPDISHPHRVAGTPGYMSPEQLLGAKIDHRTDLYSAGIMLFALCVGRKPFEAPDDMDVLRQHLHTPPPSPRKTAPDKNISAALEKVILRALEKDRDKRFYSAEDMLKALRATPEGGAVSSGSWRRVAAILFLLLAGGAGGVYGRAWWQSQHPPPVPIATTPTPSPVIAPAPVVAPPPVEEPPTPAPIVEAQDAAEVVDAASAADLAPAAPSPPPVEAPPSTEQRVEALITDGKLGDAERLLMAEAILQPKAGWVHLLLGNVYFERIWRRDAIREWQLALQMEPKLRRDPRLHARLCYTLAPSWKGAGEHFILSQIGKDAADSMVDCMNGSDPEKSRAAIRVLERTGQGKRVKRK